MSRLLDRHEDPSGISGTGVVAEGIEWTDKTVALRWLGDTSATAVWDSVEKMLAVHSHGGKTVVRWIDAGATMRDVLGRVAPSPTEPGRKGAPRLSPRFVEWLMGLPEGVGHRRPRHLPQRPAQDARQRRRTPAGRGGTAMAARRERHAVTG